MLSSKTVSLVTYNIEGLSQLYEPEMRCYLADFDFCFIVETFATTFPSSLFPLYDVFVAPGVKLSEADTARLSGGVALLVKKELGKFVKQVKVEYDNMIVLKLASNLFGTDTPVVLLGVYIPPISSNYYRETEIHNGVALVEQCILDLIEEIGEVPFILLGDFNARTGNNSPESGEDEQVLFDIFADTDYDLGRANGRSSKDKEVNDFGKYLLNVCEEFDFQILNGSKYDCDCGNFTYVSSSGCSVIDYYIISRNLLPLSLSLKVAQRVESKHMPVELTIGCQREETVNDNQTKSVRFEKFVWNAENSQDFLTSLVSEEVQSYFREASALIDSDINQSLLKFNEGLLKAGQCMKKSIVIGKEKKQLWFDFECAESRRQLRRHLRKYHSSNGVEDRINYTQKRKEYKELLRMKKTTYRKRVLDSLHENKNNPKAFWGTLKNFVSKKSVSNTVSKQEWFDHFSRVFNPNKHTRRENVDDDTVKSNEECINDNALGTADSDHDEYRTENIHDYLMHTDDDCVNESDFAELSDGVPEQNATENNGGEDTNIESLERNISEAEVYAAIRALKNGKAAGPDGIISEFFKNSASIVVPFLVKYLNKLFSLGLYPDAWSEAIIHPLFKKGDPNVPDNYRGISLLNICSKIYSYILNKRLVTWIEENNIIDETQAGFRKGHSTVDHIFTLMAIIQKQLSYHKKLYVAFIDFRKAFDSIVRMKLWTVLKKHGIKGKMYQAITGMYNTVKAKVRAGSDLTESFMCPLGLKQGDICSPVLFSLFINELANEIMQQGRHGIQLLPDLVQILILLFADDVILASDTVCGLQNQLNILSRTANHLDLVVNLDKSNIVVFRNGGHIAAGEKWMYNNNEVEVVNMYKYLGIYLSTRLTFSHALNDMADRAKKGAVAIFRLLWSLGERSPSVFFKLFDTQIQPMLTYGAEVWGLDADHTPVERVHLFALKRFLNVSMRTPNVMVYGETGRHPLYVNTFVKCIRYWLHILKMSPDRLQFKAYKMLLHLHEQNRKSWASSVCYVLYMYGFGEVWVNQGVGDEKAFLREFKERLLISYEGEWRNKLRTNERYSFYSTFKSTLSLSSYLSELNHVKARNLLIRIRLGVSQLKTHRFRFANNSSTSKFACPFCSDERESEIHFVLKCPAYDEIRAQYIPRKYYNCPTLFKLTHLLASENKTMLLRLANYVSKAFQVRNAVQM